METKFAFKKLVNPLFKGVAFGFGLLLVVGIAFAFSTWTPGQVPQANPANGNVQLAACPACPTGYSVDTITNTCVESHDWLIYHFHTASDCSVIGTNWTDGGGNRFCKINAASCPSGWTQYLGWSETNQNASCSYCGSGCNPCSCSPGGHIFSNNNAIETCVWSYGQRDKYGNGCSASTCSTTRIAIGCY